MKIQAIRLKNLHSLKGEHHIDFQNDRLSDAGLFLISGPTGSGKSTLLDAITLALFNRIPRHTSGKITKDTIEREGFILTRNANDCYAEVQYECKGKSYVSSWKIERNRNGKLKERVQVLSDASTHEIICEGVEAVPSKNAAIIGLSYEQLVQSMILAQGQFSKLLLASRDERNVLLEKITGTEFYRFIGIKAYEKYLAVKRELEYAKLLLSNTELLSDEEEAAKKEQMEVLQTAYAALDMENRIFLEKQTIKRSLVQLEADKNRLLLEKNQIKEEAENLQAVFTKYKAYSRLLPLLNDYENWKVLQTSVNNVQVELQQLHADLSTLSEAQKINFQEIEAQTFLSITDTEQTLDSLLNLVNEVREKEAAFHLLQQTFDSVEQTKRGLFQKLSTKEPQVNWAECTVEFSQQKWTELSDKLSENGIESELDIREKRLAINEIQSALSAYRSTWSNWKMAGELATNSQQNWNELKARLEESKEQLDYFQALHSNFETERETAEKALRQAETNRSLDQYRADLQEGEPCPLCGATHHPDAAGVHEQTLLLLRETFQLKEKKRNENREQITRFQTQEQQISTELERQERALLEQNQQVQNLQQALDTLCQKWNWEKSLTLDSLEEKEKEALLALSNLEDLSNALEIKALLTELLAVFEKQNQVEQQLQDCKSALRALSKSNANALDQLYKKAEKVSVLVVEKSKEFERKTASCNEQTERAKELKSQMESLFNIHAIHDWEDFTTAILSQEKAAELSQIINTHEQRKAVFQNNWELAQQKWEQFTTQDDTSISLEEVEQKLLVLKDQMGVNQQELGAIKQMLEANNRAKLAFADKQANYVRLQKDFDLWSVMNRLIGEQGGKRFSNFVQDLTMLQLLEFGNARLRSFSDRYVLALPDENSSDSLQVLDMHMGQVRRSVSSLSGGETFRLSLALAFGLSDLAAGNVAIHSLFIDEGFGTLDADSLDQAIGILEDLQNKGNKLIGIISHVGELKERISAKINMVPNGPGFSRIEVE